MPARSNPMTTDRHLLTLLVCPVTGGPLQISDKKDELVSGSGKIAFPIRDGIPILVIGEARDLTPAELEILSK